MSGIVLGHGHADLGVAFSISRSRGGDFGPPARSVSDGNPNLSASKSSLVRLRLVRSSMVTPTGDLPSRTANRMFELAR